MPRVYLSPSLQEFNPFINGGSEEEIMNLIADAMEPYLEASGIEFVRNSLSIFRDLYERKYVCFLL